MLCPYDQQGGQFQRSPRNSCHSRRPAASLDLHTAGVCQVSPTCSASFTLSFMKMTPMLPVMVPGCARILLQGAGGAVDTTQQHTHTNVQASAGTHQDSAVWQAVGTVAAIKLAAANRGCASRSSSADKVLAACLTCMWHWQQVLGRGCATCGTTLARKPYQAHALCAFLVAPMGPSTVSLATNTTPNRQSYAAGSRHTRRHTHMQHTHAHTHAPTRMHTHTHAHMHTHPVDTHLQCNTRLMPPRPPCMPPRAFLRHAAAAPPVQSCLTQLHCPRGC